MWLSYVITGAALVPLALVGMAATDVGPWYQSLKKPKWNPPNWAFPVVWTSIYILITVAIGLAWNRASDQHQSTLLWVTGINFVLNALWSVVFFKWRLLGWALIEMTLLWVSITVMILTVFPYSSLSGWLLTPYLAWVTIAFLLNTIPDHSHNFIF